MDNCIFCKIVKEELASFKILENEEFLAFLSIGPHTPGHTLVILRKHVNYFFDLEDEVLAGMMVFAKPIARALKIAFQPKSSRVGVLVAGSGVPHVHVHLIPLNNEDDLNMEKANHNVSPEEFLENQQKIIGVLNT